MPRRLPLHEWPARSGDNNRADYRFSGNCPDAIREHSNRSGQHLLMKLRIQIEHANRTAEGWPDFKAALKSAVHDDGFVIVEVPELKQIEPSISIGLGDRLAAFFQLIGIRKRKGCGCDRRQAWLNAFGFRLKSYLVRLTTHHFIATWHF